MGTRSLIGAVLAGCLCAGAAERALGQACASYTVAPGTAAFVAGTTDIGLYADDNTMNITLPFSFSLYANAYTSVYVDSNGFMDFTTAHTSGFYANACLPYAAAMGPAIMAHWDDLVTLNAGEGIFTAVLGTAPNRTFVIEWRAGHYDTSCSDSNFEVLLYENTSSFDVVYGDTGTCAGNSATVGVQDAGGTGGSTQYSCNSGVLTPGLSLHFTCVTPTEGACCNASGACTNTTPGACSGAFQGVGVACAPTNPCGGACCDASANCTVTVASGCPATSLFTNGALCSPSPCPLGVCCSNLGGTCTVTLSTTCPSSATFTSGILCSPSPCVAIGICCDFITSECTVIYGGFCSITGTFDGSTFSCTPPPCTPLAWACCLADGSCISLFQNDCGGRNGVWAPGSACGSFVCSGSPNLLANPGAEVGDLSGWTLTANTGGGEHAGDNVGWSATNDQTVHSGANAFSTSYALDERYQVIDLLAAGYTAAQLDAAPTIVAGEWVASRFDSGASYYVKIDLLAADQTTVIMTMENGDPGALIQIPAGTAFFQVTSTFTGYGPGVRYAKFSDGGISTNFWAGHYGAHFDDAFLSVLLTSACCSGSSCSVMSNADCINAGGSPAAAGSTCTANPCGGGGAGVCCRGSTCNTTITLANCTATGTAGAHFAIGGSACNAGTVSSSPCCYADYNKVNGITVQDIFDFLTDWFASSPYANVGHTGAAGALTVQNIFDFLNNWFAGGCS